MGILSGNPYEEPMHYGEVIGAWSYLNMGKGCVVAYQTFINHAGDNDLKNLLEEAIQITKEQNQQIEELLKTNGIALPPTPPERPKATLEDIPAGARFNDAEISNAVSMDTAKSLIACSQMIGQSIREDISAMYGKFHMEKSQFGLKSLRLNKEKGWLIPPPLHVKTPERE